MTVIQGNWLLAIDPETTPDSGVPDAKFFLWAEEWRSGVMKPALFHCRRLTDCRSFLNKLIGKLNRSCYNLGPFKEFRFLSLRHITGYPIYRCIVKTLHGRG